MAEDRDVSTMHLRSDVIEVDDEINITESQMVQETTNAIQHTLP